MVLPRLLFIGALLTASATGQLATQNPLDQLKEQVAQVLADAAIPFTPEQEKQLALFIEEQRQASEDLFGVIMDFSGGPPQGEQRDRALAGIQWMHDQFKKKLPDFLTPAQRAAWEKVESSGATIAARIEGAGVGGVRTEQIQEIRINNNLFSAEVSGNAGRSGLSLSGERTEVIQRGGAGAFHGNFMAMFQDESLNARNPFANNKPPYHERTINGNFSGPLLQDRLTVSFALTNNRQENVGTVKAQILDGPYSLGITRPIVTRSYEGRSVLQLSNAHSLHLGLKYGMNTRENQGVGDFNLPERGSNLEGRNYDFDVRHIAIVSERTVYETRFEWHKDYSETKPITNGVAINVLDAFNGGSAQNHSIADGRTYEFRSLLYHASKKLVLRAGFDGWYRRDHSETENNFVGEFAFTDLASYRNKTPFLYKVTRGNPLLEMNQLQIGLFIQNDMRLSNRFTLMLGARYESQTNLTDKNNLDPRLGFAYAIGTSTVIRGGAAIFHNRLPVESAKTVLRLDGKRQYEIQIDQPGWPDPFVSGNVRIIPPSSRRMFAHDIVAPYYASAAIALEQSLPANLFLTVSTDYNRGIKIWRSRNLNAPLPVTGERPFPNEGHIYQLESRGFTLHRNFKVSLRQRFSIFNLTANYAFYSGYTDDGEPAPGLNQGGPGTLIPTDNYDIKSEWGRFGGASTHTFSTNINSRLPLDVYLNSVISAKSGATYNITTGKDDNRDGTANDRPPGFPHNSAVGPHYFNVTFNFSKAFQLSRPSLPTGGGDGRNTSAGPQVNVFANLNNAFNMTHLGTPSGVMTSPFFGKSFNAIDPREIEVGMRFQF